MPKTSPRKRAIDQEVSLAERDLRSAFAFVAKKRANIWVTAAGVLFVLGIATAFLTIGDSAMQGNAAFLRAGSTVTIGTTGTTSVTTGSTSTLPTITPPPTTTREVTSTTTGTGTSTGNPPTIGINNAAGNPYTTGNYNCSWRTPTQCAVTIIGSHSSAQAEEVNFSVYATPQRMQCAPGDPGYTAGDPFSCKFILGLWPSIKIDWGDGSYQSSSIRTTYKHAYLAPGTYTITATAQYNQQQFFLPDGNVTPIGTYTIAPVTHTMTVTVASSAVLTARPNSGTRPAGGVTQNATNVEFAKIDLLNDTDSPKTINGLLIGCKDGYTPVRSNGTAGAQPFATNKYFTVQSTSGGGLAIPFSSGREFGGAFPQSPFLFDAQLLFKCKSGAYRAGIRSGNTPIVVPAHGSTTVSLIADVGPADPCTRLQLGVIAAYQDGKTGPLLANAVMGNLQVVTGTNALTGETCTAASAGGSRTGAQSQSTTGTK